MQIVYFMKIMMIIMHTHSHVQCVLVQGYPASTSWSFPKGKKESNEGDVEAAIREVGGTILGCHGNV